MLNPVRFEVVVRVYDRTQRYPSRRSRNDFLTAALGLTGPFEGIGGQQWVWAVRTNLYCAVGMIRGVAAVFLGRPLPNQPSSDPSAGAGEKRRRLGRERTADHDIELAASEVDLPDLLPGVEGPVELVVEGHGVAADSRRRVAAPARGSELDVERQVRAVQLGAVRDAGAVDEAVRADHLAHLEHQRPVLPGGPRVQQGRDRPHLPGVPRELPPRLVES
mmetsp:Transcript_2342/g.5353  ORF Transcript_2342/g.5353 Transcript_2342/m.5353 type:complete len:219 (-) Transcript_2342:68-724(-)